MILNLLLMGIQTKIIEIVKSLYDDGRSALRWGGVVGEWFRVMTGFGRDVHSILPILFALVFDWVMKRTTKNRNFGLRWIDEGRLGDLDFADDIAVWVGWACNNNNNNNNNYDNLYGAVKQPYRYKQLHWVGLSKQMSFKLGFK